MGGNKDADEIVYFIKIIAGFLSGLIGGMGLGGGAVLLMYLRLFESTNQLKAQGINLLFFIPIATVAVIMYIKKGIIVWKTVLLFSGAGILGAIGGIWLGNAIGSRYLGKIFAAILIIMGISQIISSLHLKLKSRRGIIKKE